LLTELQAAYAQLQRFYHNQQHLQECLTLLDEVKYLAQHPQHVALALYFHDAVYDPQANDNEAQSAAWATHILKSIGASSILIERIKQLIMATQHHVISDDDNDAKLLLDIDLAILGQEPTRFNEYELQIRQEYTWVSKQNYRIGRAKVLQSFLQRDSIYQTDYFRKRFEQQARLNIQAALVNLTN
ncbi:MAG: N-methyl-D-aspartate receptor NMDAR2C subunit, partial [Pseudomonadales bacterium]|nr:N-methyl-D-aspartate receptor NMDAR2C subunit [Pseudomonadales bacterium]